MTEAVILRGFLTLLYVPVYDDEEDECAIALEVLLRQQRGPIGVPAMATGAQCSCD